MEKTKFISIYNDAINNRITTENAILIIEEYCKINNKSEDKIKLLIEQLLIIPPLLQQYFITSLEGLSKHFEVNSITDLKTNKTLLIY